MPTELYNLNGVPIFSVGQWNGDVYVESDLDAMVQAYGQVGFKPPLKLGHDETQPLAKSDGMPALGWVTNLRRAGKQLLADFASIPKRIYELLQRKAYNRLSAEVYWDYDEGGKRLPRVLKAVALLGAEIPAVTSLAALESLYDASGKPFKRYDFGVEQTVAWPMPAPPVPVLPRKAKANAGYKPADEGGFSRCGACRFFQGAASPGGEEICIGSCALVEGEVASTFACDLLEGRDAFFGASKKAAPRRYQENEIIPGKPVDEKIAGKPVEVRPEGGQFCVYKGEQKLECFPTQEEADQLVATMAEGEEGEAENKLETTGGEVDIASALETAGQALLDAGAALESLKGVSGIGGKKEKPKDEGTGGGEGGGEKKPPFGGKDEGKKPPFGGKGAPPFGGKGKPFTTDESARKYIIQKRGKEWCLMTHDGSKTLGCHPTEEAAMAQERAVQANKGMSRTEENGKVVYRYSREAVAGFCPGCAKSMERENIRELKVTYDPVVKTYAGFSEGLCKQFAPGEGFRTRCMGSSLGANADEPGAMCNSLETWCFDNGFLASKTALDKAAKVHADAQDRRSEEMTDEQIAEMEALKQKVAELTTAAETGKAEAEAKLAEAETKIKDYEAQITVSQAEKAAAEESKRQTENKAWLNGLSEPSALRMLPSERPYAEFLLDALTAGETKVKAYVRKFTKDGKEETEELPAAKIFKRLFEMRNPKTQLFTELSQGTSTAAAGKPEVPESMVEARNQAAQMAREHVIAQAKAGKTVNFKEALAYVWTENPELKKVAAGSRPEGEVRLAQESARMARHYGVRLEGDGSPNKAE